MSGYPKSGSTYLRFLLYTYLTGNDPQYQEMENFIPYIGRTKTLGDQFLPLFKTHELPHRKYKSGVFLIRDGRPVAWSLFRSVRRRERFAGEFSDFLRLQVEGKFGGYGSWQQHTQAWFDYIEGDAANWIILHYEDLIDDPAAALSAVIESMRLEPKVGMIDQAVRSCTPDAIRRAEMAAPMFAKLIKAGKTPIVGDGFKRSWREAFSEDDMVNFEQSAGKQLEMIEKYRKSSEISA
ncbi:MAG: sulfotransferase domain-containing protein [Hyphomonadaceae bacterium]|nr:sulfotransferase domain-containing protein [Hyphomonadaceae bacterium]